MQPSKHSRLFRLAVVLFGLIAVYLLIAYVVMPRYWHRYDDQHPDFADVPRITHGGDGVPGDPLNVAVRGSQERLHDAMQAAGWYVADKLDVYDSLRIATDTVLHRTYDRAPVSSLYLFGRREDVAFEMPIGKDPRRRHHVRFWRQVGTDDGTRWIGAASMDVSVGLAHNTGEITHHIAPDVDRERDHVLDSLRRARQSQGIYFVDGYHRVRSGRNGGGDPWHTDGRLGVAVLADR